MINRTPSSRRAHLHCLTQDAVMVGQKACQYPNGYSKAKLKRENGEVVWGQMMKALRISIRDQIASFRVSCKKTTNCPITGECIKAHRIDTEVDHHQPDFKYLVDSFIKTHPHHSLQVRKRDGFNERLVDPATEQAWNQYHKEHANLRLLSKEGHRRKNLEA